jgi:glycosyltransferase involved in cell wall biosynthesis
MPLVSIIIPTYNRVKLLPRALESVLAQTGIRKEIIVVDDGSTDDTAQGVRNWCQTSGVDYRSSGMKSHVSGETSLLLISLPCNSGPAVARNRGMAAATGEYVAFLDSDDEWLAGSLSARLEVLKQHENVDLVYCDIEDIEHGCTTQQSFLHTRKMWSELHYSRRADGVCLPDNLFDCQLVQPMVATPTLVIRRKCLTDKMRFDERLRVAEDWEFWLRVFRQHKAGFLDRVWVRRYLQSDNLTRSPAGWGEANIMAGAIILREYDLMVSQRVFLRKRLAEDYFESGYQQRRHISGVGTASKCFALSLRYWPTWKALKWFIYTVLSGVKDNHKRTRGA